MTYNFHFNSRVAVLAQAFVCNTQTFDVIRRANRLRKKNRDPCLPGYCVISQFPSRLRSALCTRVV